MFNYKRYLIKNYIIYVFLFNIYHFFKINEFIYLVKDLHDEEFDK